MNTRIQLWCAWSIVPFVVIYILAWGIMAGFVPPSSPLLSGQDLAQFYEQDRLAIRAGNLIGIIVAALLLTWPAAISAQMARIEKGPLPILSLVQYVSCAVLCVFFMVCNLAWSIAAFRPELNPDTLRMLHDTGWLVFVMAYPEFSLQAICIAVIGFMDKRPQPFLPRWACYVSLWVAFVATGGGFSTFFKSGPFAWNGLLAFWLPAGFWICWTLGILLPFVLKAIRRQMAEEGGAA